MTTTTTDKRVRLEIPSPSTTVTVGLFDDTSTSYSGVSVNTVEHVRFYGSGGSAASDAIGQASGQVWLQSLRHLVGLADGKVMLSADVATIGAAKKGITVMSGFSSAKATSESSPATMPDAVSGYESKAAIAQGFWAIFEATMMAATTALGVKQALLLHQFPWIGATGALANVAGASLNIVGLTGSKDIDLPGVHLFSEGGTFVGSNFSTVTVAALGGVWMGSLFTHQFGLWGSSIRGWKRASIGANGPVDISSLLWFESKSDGSQQYGARAGKCSIKGQTMEIGTLKWKLPQIPTLTVKMEALTEVSFESPLAVELDAAVDLETSAQLATDIAAVQEATVVAGPWSISVQTASVKMGATAAQPAIKIDGSGVTILAPSAASTYAKMSNGAVELKCKSASLKTQSGTITINGTELKLD